MGKSMAYGCLSFLGTGCPVLDDAINYLAWNDSCNGNYFYIHQPP